MRKDAEVPYMVGAARGRSQSYVARSRHRRLAEKKKLYWKVLGEADTRSDALAASTVASQSCPVARATQSGGRVDWQSSMLDPRSGNTENLHREEWVGELDDALHVYAPNLENKGPVMICAAACSSILHFFETNVYTRPQ